MKKLLITGFNPFNKEKINPSFEAVKRLEDRILGYEIIKKEISTEYDKSILELRDIMDKENPSIVILVGQAGGRTNITVERIAINIREASIADNADKIAKNERIYSDGLDGYFSNLPLYSIVESLKTIEIPAAISNSAGTFVCNNLLYSLMYDIDKNNLDRMGGFIHVPYIREQALECSNRPSMELDIIVKALRKIVEVSIEEREKNL